MSARDTARLTALKAFAARRPLEILLAIAFVLLALYSAGYAVGKDKALADNRADHERHDR